MRKARHVTVHDRLIRVSARGPGFDQIRLAAALIVLFHHSWWGVEDVLFHYSRHFVQLGLLAVIVFFSISGFLVTPGLARSGDLVRFAVHRSLRIFPALLAVVLASMFVLGPLLTQERLSKYFSSPELYLYGKNVLTLMAHSLPGVERDGAPAEVNGALWTLNIEVFSYALLAGLSIVGILQRRAFALLAFGLVYAAYVALKLNQHLGEIVPTRLSDFIGLFVYFIAGTNLFLYAERIPFSGKFAAAAVLLMLIGLPTGLGAVVMPFCAPYILVYLGLSHWLGRNPVKHDLSYGVYLIHSPVILAVTSVLNLSAGWLTALLTVAVTLPLAKLSATYIEEPALRRKRSATQWASVRVQALLGGAAQAESRVAASAQSDSAATSVSEESPLSDLGLEPGLRPGEASGEVAALGQVK